MAQLPAWVDEVSDHVLDAQAIVMRAEMDPGAKQQALAALIRAQERIGEVDAEITGTLTLLRTGRRPRRLRACNDEPTAA